ncbi:type IV pilus twitching motility protein PilT [Fimbriiglobus ruber]|uniref:Twitching motility protein PilT n=1 Tax=Fimbriiglobus ruber TaxID=1908690 RepID=A0A225DHJ2_9BACT|nr:PilT/PilU family type 4a pilus ATPase [Fimbriiglobus ruber]OWK36649.1 Twitching motility protein PilT [Fimbriiglobus ruber]
MSTPNAPKAAVAAPVTAARPAAAAAAPAAAAPAPAPIPVPGGTAPNVSSAAELFPPLPPNPINDPNGGLKVNPPVPGEPAINQIFRTIMLHQASDLHLKSGMPGMMRLRGAIQRMATKVLSQDDLEKLIYPVLTEKSRKTLDEKGGADFAYVVGNDECRFRVNLFKQRGKLAMVARRVNTSIPSFEKLGLPPTIEKLCHYEQGMVILAGVTGSGKSTTIASMLDYINQHEALHILTIEDPIEFVFNDKMSVMNQREVYLDVHDWHLALKHAVRQDPDLILVGEMRDQETFEAGVHAAETGHVVFGTIHASSAASTVSRILDLFQPSMHHAVRQSLAFNMKAIVAQKLVPSIKPGVQRVPTNEIMIINPTIRDLILKSKDDKLGDAIKIGALEGMIDFTESLRQLVERGDIDKATALEFAPNPDQLKMAFKGIKFAAPGIL